MTRGAKMLMMRGEGNRTNREYGRTENHYPYMGEDMRYEMRGEGGSNGRNDYGEMPRNEYGNMNYGESRFRDRRGREHYDNGRFAPRNDMNEMRGEDYDETEMRRGSGGRSHYPFGPVPPIYEREPGMNRIGFAAEPRREMESSYPMNANYPRMEEMGHRTSDIKMGHGMGGDTKLTEDMAHEWMEGLHNEDGTKGAHWTMDQVKQVMNQRNIREDPLLFWVAMNASYSDLCSMAKKHSVNTMDFYVDYSKAFWFNDKDAVKDKLLAYFINVVK